MSSTELLVSVASQLRYLRLYNYREVTMLGSSSLSLGGAVKPMKTRLVTTCEKSLWSSYTVAESYRSTVSQLLLRCKEENSTWGYLSPGWSASPCQVSQKQETDELWWNLKTLVSPREMLVLIVGIGSKPSCFSTLLKCCLMLACRRESFTTNSTSDIGKQDEKEIQQIASTILSILSGTSLYSKRSS